MEWYDFLDPVGAAFRERYGDQAVSPLRSAGQAAGDWAYGTQTGEALEPSATRGLLYTQRGETVPGEFFGPGEADRPGGTPTLWSQVKGLAADAGGGLSGLLWGLLASLWWLWVPLLALLILFYVMPFIWWIIP